MSRIVYNAIKTPDNTILVSRHRHDYKEHLDANGEVYMVDGGNEYIRRSVNKEPAEDLIVTEDDPIEVIREVLRWGTFGKNGDQPLTYVLLKDMEDAHIKAILDNYTTVYENVFKRELEYRGVDYE